MNPDYRYRGRHEAGAILALRLRGEDLGSDPVILALPRGGVPVAAAIARELRLPLEVFLVRKLGVPGNPELAMGAIASGGVELRDAPLIADARISESTVATGSIVRHANCSVRNVFTGPGDRSASTDPPL